MRQIALLVLISLSACTTKKVPLNHFRSFYYGELPANVQEVFRHPGRFSTKEIHAGVFNLDSIKYEFKVKNTGPWTDYSLLINRSDDHEYSIPADERTPFCYFQGCSICGDFLKRSGK